MISADISYDTKHQLILPPKCRLTQLIIEELHKDTLHGGGQLVLGILRQRFWIPNARNVIRKVAHKCVTCCRHRAIASSQLMGDLPQGRVTPGRVFASTGVDYCGPFNIRLARGRGHVKTIKCWIAVFVCFVVKAVHLELVGDMSTESFIAALRFVARRGACKDIYLDNGTYGVGASNRLTELHSLFTEENKSNVRDGTLIRRISTQIRMPKA